LETVKLIIWQLMFMTGSISFEQR